MVKRLVVKLDDPRDKGSPFLGLVPTTTSLVMAAMLLLGSFRFLATDLWQYTCVLALVLLVTIASQRSGHRQRSHSCCWTREARFYPVGIQLSRVHRATGESTQKVFIPRQDIKDCIVSEVILAHRVISCVLLRVARNNETRLVEVFQGMELSFLECMTMRNKIDEYIKSIEC